MQVQYRQAIKTKLCNANTTLAKPLRRIYCKQNQVPDRSALDEMSGNPSTYSTSQFRITKSDDNTNTDAHCQEYISTYTASGT